ncbi:hypothetical protein GCM10017559_77490 [Streptosporangium longisporum]|uniref:Uncharacterized protein n=1 Tax=Streptosporangium longisporum TaxID=46187 RepID=A0ABP6LDI3_9ACTN
MVRESLAEPDGVVDAPALAVVGGVLGEPSRWPETRKRTGKLLGPDRAHRVDDPEREPRVRPS